jgi:hypothetical protein
VKSRAIIQAIRNTAIQHSEFADMLKTLEKEIKSEAALEASRRKEAERQEAIEHSQLLEDVFGSHGQG